jgi:hypothetical protein
MYIDLRLRGYRKFAIGGVLLIRIVAAPVKHGLPIGLVGHPVLDSGFIIGVVGNSRRQHRLRPVADDGDDNKEADEAKVSHTSSIGYAVALVNW